MFWKTLLGLTLLLRLPSILSAAPDAETMRLEALALCQAMPYRCAPPPTIAALERTHPEVNVLCAELLAPLQAIRNAFTYHRRTTAQEDQQWNAWRTSCAPTEWQTRLTSRVRPLPLPVFSSTVECRTTSSASGDYIATTCHAY
jgi:hypothetical protein